MSAPQTKSELPKNGASTRLAAISIPRSTAPARKTATVIATARTRIERSYDDLQVFNGIHRKACSTVSHAAAPQSPRGAPRYARRGAHLDRRCAGGARLPAGRFGTRDQL